MDGPTVSRLSPLLPFLLLLCLTPLCLSAAPCPRSCQCPQPTDLHCTFKSLLSVPNNVNRNVERINLGFNRIGRISDKSFSGLTRLEMLLIHGNDLHSLPDGAFKDLSALQMLKLSYNQLREVSRHTFIGLWSLARLHLDHNSLESIDPDAFQGLTSLRLLQLEGNRIKRLHASTFTTFTVMDHFHLSTLKHLYLSNNSLTVVPREMLETMPQLENLFLHGNPWVCDCNLRWIHRWLQLAPGVLKCKKDRSLPGGQLCPTCSSPRNLHQKLLQAQDNMVCSSPVIKTKDQHTEPEETDNDFTFLDDFMQPFGNISLGLSDEHGNDVELECSFSEPRDASKISFEQVDKAKMVSNVTVSLDLDCDVDREKYERLWRLIAYYSNVPAHLKRSIMLTKDPYPMYVYKQDSDKDALYYTGVKANIMVQPTWLMQPYMDLQLNRHGSSGKQVKLILTTQLSQNLDLEMNRRQSKTWVMVEETNLTQKTAILGKVFDLQCSVQSTGEPIITWILPDGTKLVAPSGNRDDRVSISADGRLVIKIAEHKDAGNYFCVAKVDEDMAVSAFYVSIQESSNPQPGEDQAIPTELFSGNSLNLDCDSLGSPDPEINWIIPNGNIVSFRSNSTRVFVYSNGTLHIPQTLIVDDGFYKCIALNRHGVDTKAAKVVVKKRPGMVRPLGKFPMRPQSASGVNTKVKVHINDLEEGSGDIEDASNAKPARRIVPIRNGVHPSRNTRRRPPILLRKPNLQNTENGKNILDHRRRMNMAKINPERWADILAKIRIKNKQFVTIASPVIATTSKLTTQFSEQTTFGREEPSIEKYATTNSQDLTTLTHEAIKAVQEKSTQSLTTQEPIIELRSVYSLPMATVEPLTSQSFPNLQQTPSSNTFFLSQTTSAPLQAVTLWQANPNTPRKNITSFQQGDIELEGGKPANSKKLKVKGNRKNKTRLSKLKKVKGGQVLPTAVPVMFNGDDKIVFNTQKPKLDTIISVVSKTNAQIWNKLSSTEEQKSKRRNGNRKKKTNRRKNKLNKTVKNNLFVSTNVDQVTAMPTKLKLDVLGSSNPVVQFERGQEPTASPKEHETSTKSSSKLAKKRIFSNNQVLSFITTAFPYSRLDMLPSDSQHKFTSHPLPPVKPLAQTPMQNAIADSSSGELRHAKGKLIQSRQGYTAPEGYKHLVNGSREQLESGSSSLASLTEHKVEEMYHSQDTSELIATTGIDFEVLTVTKQPKTSHRTSNQNEMQDTKENVSIVAFTTALPMSTPYVANPKMAATEPILKESYKLSTSITSGTKKSHSQSESLVSSDVAIPKTTTSPKMLKDTNQHATDSHQLENLTESLQTQDELVFLAGTAFMQTPSTHVSLKIDHQSQASTTSSMFLQSAEAKTTIVSSLSADSTPPSPINSKTVKTTTPPLYFTLMSEETPTIIGSSNVEDSDQSNQRNLPKSPGDSLPDTRFMPSTLSYTTQKVTSIRPNREPIKQEIHVQAKSTNFSHTNVEIPVVPTILSRTSTQQVTILTKLNSEAKLRQTTVAPQFDAPPQLTQTFLDFISQSPNHKMNQFITSNPAMPTVNLRTTLAPTYSLHLVNLWTERPQARPTTKPPALSAYPRGKPRITRGNFQTMSVKAETDAVLPCAANGEPKPFLSWTKVSTGTSIPQNTRLQRFEVHKNGTLIIRNTQPLDGGEYLCTVQNQYGSDQILINLVVLSQHPKILQPRHRDFSVNIGSNIDIDCQVEGHPKPRVSWVLPNQAQIAAAPYGLASTNHVRILQNGTLRILQAGFSDRGIYKCVGSSTSGADTVSVRLYVSALPPVFKQMPVENITATEDGTVFLHCSANSSPQPTIRWTTPDRIQLTSSQYLNGGKTMVFPNGTLLMQSLTQGNAGKYECLASNILGTSKRTVNLVVKNQMLMAKARITMSSAKLTEVVYGGRLHLDCVAKGDPQPRVIWRTPSRKLVDSQYSYDSRIQVYPNGSITIHSLTDKDGGDYLCVARNKIGDDYVVLRVEVLTKPAKIEQTTQHSNQEVFYGGDLKVDCVASGLPNPEISWALPDGTMINTEKRPDRASGGRKRRYVVFDNGTLFFNDVGTREEGDYTCYAENELGKDEMKIHVKVKTASSPPRILDKTQTSPIQVTYGGNLTLQCHAKGDPTPTFTWISPMNRFIVPNKDKYQVLNNGELVVQKVQRFDAGDYTCMARNSAGQDSRVIKVEVLVMPPVISNMQGQNFRVSAIQNEPILLDCVAKGTPNPRIMWVLPGNVILPAPYHSNRMTVYQNGTLEIRSAKKSDTGQLACIARNEGGEVRLAVSLDVKEANAKFPVSRNKMDTVSLTAGNAMTLNCSFDNHVFLPVTWVLPNGASLPNGARFMKFFHHQDGSLIISNPSLAEAGTYQCLGHKNGSQFQRIVQLVPGRKPEITNRYNSPINIMNGEMLMLHCMANGEPLRLTWTLPSGVILNRPQKAGRYSVLQNGTLAIQQVSIYDRGFYVCRAANEYGSSVMSVSVIVNVYPPRITDGPNSMTYAKRGVALQLNCVATGVPDVEVSWETPDKSRLVVSAQPRFFGNKYLNSQGSLVIQSPTQRDVGVYRCTARNAIGVDSKTTYLNVY